MKLNLFLSALTLLMLGSTAHAENPWTGASSKFMGKVFTIQSSWSGRFLVGSGIGLGDKKNDYADLNRNECAALHGGTGKDDLDQWYIFPLGEISNGVVIVNKKTGYALGAGPRFRAPLKKTEVWDPKLRSDEANADLLASTSEWGPSTKFPQEATAQVWMIEDAGTDEKGEPLVQFRLRGETNNGKLYLNLSDIRTDQGYDPKMNHKGIGAIFNLMPSGPAGNPHADSKYQAFRLKASDVAGLPAIPKVTSATLSRPKLVDPDLQSPKNPRKSDEITKGYTLIPAIWGTSNKADTLRKTPFLLLERKVVYTRDDRVSRENGTSAETPASKKTTTTGVTQTTRDEFTAKVGLSVGVSAGGKVMGVGVEVTATATAELGYSYSKELSERWEESFEASYGPFPPHSTVAYFHLTDIFVIKKPSNGQWVDMAGRWEVPVNGNDVSSEIKHTN